jgi:spore coat protein A, manganese oxidase
MQMIGRQMSRRELMKLGLFSSAALMLPVERVARTQVALDNRMPQSALPQPFTLPFKTPPVLAPEHQTQNFDYYSLVQRQAGVEILPGLRTDVWGYNGIAPGPTIVAHRGRKAVVQQVNELPSVHPTLRYNVWTSTHLHGSASKPHYDGYASDISQPGEWKDYVYPNFQEARTLWYHDHGVHITAPNAYMGLAAMYIMHDEHELSLPIPHGDYDVPLVLRDAMFQSDGQLLYNDNDHSGVYGDVILVNGVPWPSMQVERRKYRFRILNASVSRSYDLKLDTDEPMVVIGTDGGLVPHPMPVARLKSGMAERYEVVIDFSKYQIGQRVVMENVSPKNNIDHETTGVVMAFDVVADARDTRNNEVPYDLNPSSPVMALNESDAVRTRHFEFERKGGNWTINDTTWSDVVNSDYKKVLANPGLDDVEIWELTNSSGGWFHPIHIHLVDFKVLDRDGRPPRDYELGPKDTVYVGEGETVRVLIRFEHEQGRYMMHCHNLVHEDHDMMAQFCVGDEPAECDPIYGDHPKKGPPRPVRDRDDEPDEPDDSGGGGDNSGSGSSNSGSGSSNSGSGSANSGSGSGDRLSGSSTGSGGPQAKASSIAKKPTCAPKKQLVKKKTKRSALNKRTAVKRPAAKSSPANCLTPEQLELAKRKELAKRRELAKRKALAKRRALARRGKL